MKPNPKLPRPTECELDILRVLWERGPSTVRQVHDALSERRTATAYTTVLKIMQIMSEKGLVERDQTERAHVYQARMPREKTERQMIGHLLDRVFEGSASKLMMQALAARKAKPEEIAEMRAMLDEAEKRGVK